MHIPQLYLETNILLECTAFFFAILYTKFYLSGYENNCKPTLRYSSL